MSYSDEEIKVDEVEEEGEDVKDENLDVLLDDDLLEDDDPLIDEFSGLNDSEY